MCVNRGWQVMIAPCLPRFGGVRFRWAFVAGCGVRILARLSRSWTLYLLRRSTSSSTRRLYEYAPRDLAGAAFRGGSGLVCATVWRRCYAGVDGAGCALWGASGGLPVPCARVGFGTVGRV